MAHYDTILLDLDGTIVDAFTTIHRSYVHTLPQFGVPAPTHLAVRRAVGGGLENAMRHFLPVDAIPEAAKIFNAYTQTILLEDVRLLPGALELIRAQHERGTTLAVYTNKLGVSARRICDHLGISPLLKGIYGAKDTPWLKPQREFSIHALEKLGAAPEKTLLIGDSPFDVEAARNGGFACWAVTTGTHSAEELQAARAAAVFSDLFAVQAALEA